MDVRQFEQNVRGKSYPDIEIAMKPLSDSELLELLDSKSIKIGDTAVMLLSQRDQFEPVIDRVLDGKVTTKNGRGRATNLVKSRGKACARAAEVFLYLIHDRTLAVVSTTLFGLVFLQDKQHLVAIREAMAGKKKGTEVYVFFTRAVEALEKQDPSIYSPYFRDAGDLWKLDKERFGHKIGQFKKHKEERIKGSGLFVATVSPRPNRKVTGHRFVWFHRTNWRMLGARIDTPASESRRDGKKLPSLRNFTGIFLISLG